MKQTTRREFVLSLARGGALALLLGGLLRVAGRDGVRRRCPGCSPGTCPEHGCRFRDDETPSR